MLLGIGPCKLTGKKADMLDKLSGNPDKQADMKLGKSLTDKHLDTELFDRQFDTRHLSGIRPDK